VGPAWDALPVMAAASQYPDLSIAAFAPSVAYIMFNFFVLTLTLLTCGAFAKRVPYVP
jgi:hypothetical protein